LLLQRPVFVVKFGLRLMLHHQRRRRTSHRKHTDAEFDFGHGHNF
jgi:hypothetical protein